MQPKQVRTYANWLAEQIVVYQRNPQVCRTFHECLKKLESIAGETFVDLSHFKLPEDRS